MPRFIRSLWSNTANKNSDDAVVSKTTPQISEHEARLQEADFVRDFQKRLGQDNPIAANVDEEPGTINIFAPVGKDSPD